MLKLGGISLDVPFFQSPLSGYSDYAMRRLALDFGAPLVFAGMMLAKSAANPKVLKKKSFQAGEDEHPIGVQIVGNDPDVMADAAAGLENVGYDLIDLNFACPALKVLRRERGGALLKEPDRVIEIFKRVRDRVNCPVIMKLRIGFDGSGESKNNFWEIAERAYEEGVDALVVHGRVVLEKYRGSADWQILKQLKEKFPEKVVIGSGDLFESKEIAELMENTGIDGVAIARGAIGNPWIFEKLRAIFEGKDEPPEPSLKQQAKVILRHFELVCRLYPAKKTIPYFRKFIVGYCKHHPHRKKTSLDFMTINDRNKLTDAIKYWYSLS